MNRIIHHWHNILDMPKYDLTWHQQDVADELQELAEARGIINRWSEISDICYTVTRAHWSGIAEIVLPISRFYYFIGLIYMIPKYHLRWRFFTAVGKTFGPEVKIREVRNPKKIEKLKTIAEKYGLDSDKFVLEAKRLMKGRVFLK